MALNDNTGGVDSSDSPQAGGPLPQPFGFSKLTQGENPNFGSRSTPGPLGNPPVQATRKRKPLEKKLNVSELIKVMYRGRWIILVTFVMVFAYTVYDTYKKPFVYSSTTRMFIDRPVGSQQVAKIVGMVGEEDHSVTNQLQFFKSHVVGQHVARLLHELAEGNRYEIDSLFTSAFGSTKDVPPDPRQLTVIRMQDNPKLPNRRGIPDLGSLEMRASTAVNAISDGSNDYLVVNSEAYSPLDAAFLANLYVAVFVKDNQARVRANSAALKQYLLSQKERSFDTLRKIEGRLRDYLGENNGMSPEDVAKAVTTQYQDLKQKKQNVELDLNLRKKIYQDLRANLDTVQRTYYDNLTLEPYIGVLQKELTESQFEVESMQLSNNMMDPRTKKYLKDEIQAKKDRIATLREKLKEVTEEYLHSQVIVAGQSEGTNELTYSAVSSSLQTITSLRQNILGAKLRIGQDSAMLTDYEEKLAQLHAEATSMPERIVQTSQLRRAQTIAEKMYTQLEDRYLEAWMTEESVFGNVKAEDPATMNAAPIRPNRQASILTGALTGLGIGIALVVVLSFLDTTIRTPEEVESHNVTLLATIPVINHPAQPLTLNPAQQDAERPKFTPHRASFLDPRSSVAESYRALRTTIQFSSLDKEYKVIAVTSSAPQEGKSTTSANLGIVMAQMGKKTLIVDADLRRPVLHSVFGIAREPGLTNLLFDRATLEEAVKETDVPNLYVLPCGIIPPNPSELLGSQRMATVLDRLREVFDVIILDTPPVVAVTDALLMGRAADATILVARADVTRIDALMRAMDSVERSGTHLLGVVLNNFNVANAYGSYYKYYQYYHYYSNTPQSTKEGRFSRLLPRGRSKTKV